MPDRYFIDPTGAVTRRMQGPPGAGHIEIGTEVMAANGIVPQDHTDVYRQMFRLKFVRVVEHDGGMVEVEYGAELTSAQNRYVAALQANGKHINLVRARLN